MLKLVAFFRRKPGLDVDGFQKHWRTRHAELVVRVPGLAGYVQNHTHVSGYHKHEPSYDGVAEAWFADGAALAAAVGCPEMRAVRQDEAHFIDASSLGSIVTREVVIVDGSPPPGALKQISFLNRRPDISVADFQHHWRERHGPIAGAIPGMRRYVQCHAVSDSYSAGSGPPYDGVPIAWFDDLAALRASGSTQQYRDTRADEAHFMVSGRLPFVIATEVPIRLP